MIALRMEICSSASRRVRVALRGLVQQLLRHLAEEDRLAGANHLRRQIELVVDPDGAGALLHLLGPAPALGILVGDDELLDLARLLDEHGDRAPVGEQRHGELR